MSESIRPEWDELLINQSIFLHKKLVKRRDLVKLDDDLKKEFKLQVQLRNDGRYKDHVDNLLFSLATASKNDDVNKAYFAEVLEYLIKKELLKSVNKLSINDLFDRASKGGSVIPELLTLGDKRELKFVLRKKTITQDIPGTFYLLILEDINLVTAAINLFDVLVNGNKFTLSKYSKGTPLVGITNTLTGFKGNKLGTQLFNQVLSYLKDKGVKSIETGEPENKVSINAFGITNTREVMLDGELQKRLGKRSIKSMTITLNN